MRATKTLSDCADTQAGLSRHREHFSDGTLSHGAAHIHLYLVQVTSISFHKQLGLRLA